MKKKLLHRTKNRLKRIVLTAIIFSIAISHSTVCAQMSFKDVTKEAGIQHQFVVYEGMFGGGACVIDFNNDGWEDIFITGGMGEDALYQNKGDGTFRNIYHSSGLTTAPYVTQGVSSADVNKDGWVDLFITTITTKDSVKTIPRAENLLFINNGNSTFRNATKEFGLDGLISFSTGVSFGDFNADGYPDAYIGNYFLDYEGQLNLINDATIVNANQTAKGYLLKNKGGKYFSNVYSDYGLAHKGFGFGAAFTDFDNDGDVDLLVNHDFGYKAVPNVFLINEYPKKQFRNAAKELGMDLKINAMGTAVGDFNFDGLLDYYVTNIRFNRMMVSQGIGKPFVDKSRELGMGYVSISWGSNFADFDHDTDLDLFVANGDLNPNDVPMADYYFENNKGVFTEKAWAKGLNDYGIGRGSVVFDMDNDGDLDILVVNQKPVLNYPVTSETRLYRNDSTKGNWIKIALKGVDSEMHGLGSRVEVVIGKIKMIREIDGGSSHLSQNSTIAHFGLGHATVADSVIVKWIGGKKQILTNQKVNMSITVTEIEGAPTHPMVFMGLLTGAAVVIFILYRSFRRRLTI
jgi:enediyne biosynthesis protein E4